MLEINDGKHYINVFDNITEIASYVTTKQRKPGRDNSSEHTDDISFYGTTCFEKAIELLKYGDENLYSKIKEEKSKIDIDKILGNATKRQNYENRVYGCVPNVPAFLKGDPINMIHMEMNRPSHKIINIFLNIRVGGFTSAEHIIKMGAKYLSVIDLLEKKGYRCNLYSGTANEDDFTDGNKWCYMLVRVKTDREPLNLKKICFTLANPSMQRRVKFRWMEVNDFDANFTSGYGGADEREHTKKILEEKLKDNFIVWTYENQDGNTNIEEILENLKKEGITIE